MRKKGKTMKKLLLLIPLFGAAGILLGWVLAR